MDPPPSGLVFEKWYGRNVICPAWMTEGRIQGAQVLNVEPGLLQAIKRLQRFPIPQDSIPHVYQLA
jgi:hypothetical protein